VIVYIIHMRGLYYSYCLVVLLSTKILSCLWCIWLNCSSIEFLIGFCRIMLTSVYLFNESIFSRCTLWICNISSIFTWVFVCVIISFKEEFSSEVWNWFLWVNLLNARRNTLLRMHICSLLLSCDLSVVIRTKIVLVYLIILSF